jgi:hypothetical protein
MKKMKCLAIFVVISLMFAGLSYSKIDEGSIIGMWLFDEGEGDVAEDASGNGNNGTLINSPKWVEGKFGGALEFSGAGDYVDTELNTDDLSSPITISLWMNPTQIKKSPLVSGYNNANPDANRWDIQLNRDGAGKIRWVEHEGRDGAISSTTLEADTWYHIAVIHDLPNSESMIFVNGVLENTAKIEQDLNTGRVVQFADGDGDTYGGLIDEVAIFNVVLSEDDIINIMNNGLAGMLSVFDKGKLATTWANIKKSITTTRGGGN